MAYSLSANRPDRMSVRNRILSALPPSEWESLKPDLELVELVAKRTLATPGEPVEFVCFPDRGIVSLLVPMQSGDAVEVGMIGSEGVVGAAAFLGESVVAEAQVQTSGFGWRIRTTAFAQAMDRCESLPHALQGHFASLHGQIAQIAACNGRHTIAQRLARWFLMAHDRCEGNGIPLTQEAIATALGVRRASVSVAAGVLRNGNLIRSRHGRIEIRDRARLEAASCECYFRIRDRARLPTGRDAAANGSGLLLPHPDNASEPPDGESVRRPALSDRYIAVEAVPEAREPRPSPTYWNAGSGISSNSRSRKATTTQDRTMKQETQPTPAPLLNGLSVLVVEDRHAVATWIVKMLRRLGCRPVGPIPSVEAGLAWLECGDGPCGAAVLDVDLRGETVYPLARALVESGASVVFATGYGVPAIAEEWRGFPIVEKPFQANELERALLVALSRPQHIPSPGESYVISDTVRRAWETIREGRDAHAESLARGSTPAPARSMPPRP